jgi:hypothetical protein
MPRGAVLCTNCGYNIVTRQRTGSGRPRIPGRAAAAPAGPVPWYKNANLYLGIILAIFAGLYGLAWLVRPLGSVIYLVTWLLYALVVGIIVLVAAFKDGVGTGFLTLCVPFYVLYFVYSKCDSKLVKALYSIGILVGLLTRVLPEP